MSKSLQIGKLYRISEKRPNFHVPVWEKEYRDASSYCPPLTYKTPFLVLSYTQDLSRPHYVIKVLVEDKVRYIRLFSTEISWHIEELNDDQ